jgi:hypothetical protein
VAFRLPKNDSIQKGLRQILAKQVQSAMDSLSQSPLTDDAVYDARKRIKKSRAVLDLARKDASAASKMIERHLRASGRQLSGLRDANAMVVTARSLCRPHGEPLTTAACRIVQPQLANRSARAMRQQQRRVRQALKELRSAERAIPRLRLERRGAAVLQSGVRRAYKRAKREMVRAQNGGQALHFHEWRKRTKTLWHQLRLLEGRAPRVRRQAAAVKQLEEQLGREHNLQVLRAHIARRRPSPARQTIVRLTELADKRQERLRRSTLQSGARVFAKTPKDFVRSMFSGARRRPR